MHHRLLRYRFILGVMFLLSFLNAHAQEPYDPEKAMIEEGRAMGVVMQTLMYGSISVRGRVVDTSGNPISGVTAYIDVSDVGGIHSTNAEISGSFNFVYKDCMAVALVFEREGYYRSETFDVCFSADIESIDSKTGAIKRTIDMVQTDILVEMVPIGKPQDLPVIMEHLTFEDGGRGSVLSLDDKEGSLVTVTDFNDWSLMPRHGMCIVANTDPEGRIVTDTNGMPVDLHVLMTSTNGDGFVKNPSEDHDYVTVSRQMQEAPADGYVRGLGIGLANTYFYFKANNVYGKGRFERIELAHTTGTVISARVELHIQENGTRNVNTRF